MDTIAAYEHELTQYATRRLKEIPGMRIFGESEQKGSVISFLVGNIHHFDLGTLLDRLGIAVRTGHHCAQPLMTSKARCAPRSGCTTRRKRWTRWWRGLSG